MTILAMPSTAVTPAMLPRATAGLCDMVVSELLDFSLFGEGMLPALRDARRRLLHPHAEAVPHAARLYGQGVALSPGTALRLQPAGGAPARVLGLHTRAIEPLQAVTLPARLFEVSLDGSAGSATAADQEPSAALPEALAQLPVHGRSGHCDAMVLWWELDIAKGTGSAEGPRGADEHVLHVPWTSAGYRHGTTYSTHPATANRQGFQDHWPQGVWVFGDAVAVTQGHSLSLLAQCADAVNLALTPVTSVPSSLGVLPQPLYDGIALPHLLAPRLCVLGDERRTQALAAALRRAVRDQGAVLDVGDGGRCTALLAAAAAHNLPVPKAIISLQPLEEARAWLRWQLHQNEDGNGDEHTARVALWAGAEAGEGWDSSWPAVDALVSDLHTLSMGNRPLWQALNFWHLRTALAPVLAEDAAIFPEAVRVMAAAVAVPNLSASHAAVGQVAGLTHASFDAAFASDSLPDSYFCLAEHWHRVLTHPVCMLTLDVAAPLALEDEASLCLEGAFAMEWGEEQADALAIWIEVGDEEQGLVVDGHPTRGGLGARQLLRWCPFQMGARCTLNYNFNVTSGELRLSLQRRGAAAQPLLSSLRPTARTLMSSAPP